MYIKSVCNTSNKRWNGFPLVFITMSNFVRFLLIWLNIVEQAACSPQFVCLFFVSRRVHVTILLSYWSACHLMCLFILCDFYALKQTLFTLTFTDKIFNWNYYQMLEKWIIVISCAIHSMLVCCFLVGWTWCDTLSARLDFRSMAKQRNTK